MRVIVYTKKSLKEYECDQVAFVAASGAVCVLENHEPSLWRLAPGEVLGYNTQKKVMEIMVSGGLAFTKENRLELSVDVSRTCAHD